MSYQLGFIGAGNMAEGILAAVLARGVYALGDIIAGDPVAERRQLFAERFGVAVTEDNARVVREARRIIVAVKPQTFEEMVQGVAGLARAEQLWISIMAGVKTGRIEAAFSTIQAHVVRAMPNLPIRVGAGMTGLFAGQNASMMDVADAVAIFEAGGATVVVEEEGLMDAVTAISGSGPAYFYYFVEAMVAGGVACGLDEGDALTLAQHACLGAARMMVETGEPPEELRRKVTSKGGTTQAALEHMEAGRVGLLIEKAVQAAFKRGQELGK